MILIQYCPIGVAYPCHGFIVVQGVITPTLVTGSGEEMSCASLKEGMDVTARSNYLSFFGAEFQSRPFGLLQLVNVLVAAPKYILTEAAWCDDRLRRDNVSV